MWPKGPYRWQEDATLYMSVPFTWNLPGVRAELMQRDFTWEKAVVGGPALALMPEYLADLDHVTVGADMPGVLQRINPEATRTTLGCPNKCRFCGIGTGRIEAGGFRELAEYPVRPIVCDNNFLAASDVHIYRACVALRDAYGWGDFNQGLDARLMTPDKAEMLAIIGKPMCRLSWDSPGVGEDVEAAADMLRSAGIAKSRIRVFALVAFDSGPDECWARCLSIEEMGLLVNPMWYHPLDALVWNGITDDQRAMGWSHKERTRLMGYFYKRRGTPPKAMAEALREEVE